MGDQEWRPARRFFRLTMPLDAVSGWSERASGFLQREGYVLAMSRESVAELAARKGPRVNIDDLFLFQDASVEMAIACIDRSGRISIALVVDESGRLINTISDGDIRRGILAGVALNEPISRILEIKARTPHPLPVCASVGTTDALILELMKARAVRQIPIVDAENRVTNVVTLGELLLEQPRALQAVVMAGGFGTRLSPLTESIPKPMLPIGGRPLMELIIEQLRHTGISKINISTHFEAEKIVGHFGDGSGFGVDISYVNEDSPLGTAGVLGLMEPPGDAIVVINGDILTDVDFGAMHVFHQEHEAKMTVAVRRYEVQVPYGVVESEGARLRALREKPSLGFFVNAGIYVLEPDVYRYITRGAYLNMTDLVERLLEGGETVVSFPVREYWLDIGQHADYELAQAEALSGRWKPSRR